MRERETIESDRWEDVPIEKLVLEVLLDLRDLFIEQNEIIAGKQEAQAFMAQSAVLLAERMGLPTELLGQSKPDNALTQEEIDALMQEGQES